MGRQAALCRQTVHEGKAAHHNLLLSEAHTMGAVMRGSKCPASPPPTLSLPILSRILRSPGPNWGPCGEMIRQGATKKPAAL